MAKRAKPRRGPPAEREAAGSGPGGGALLGAAALALAAGLWAAFLWLELVDVRAGGEATCLFDAGSGESCAAAWEGPLAQRVERATGLPIAAWGVAWALVALALPVAAWWRRRSGASPEPFASGAALVALAGVLGAVGLVASLLGSGPLCTSCLAMHALVLAYAAVLFATGGRLRQAGAGAALAAGGLAAAWLVLFLPASRMPAAGSGADFGIAAGAEAPGSDDSALARFLAGLDPERAQHLADGLAAYRRSPALPAPAPRALVLGPADAPVRITEFADLLCSHCADLHHQLMALQRQAPPGSFTVEPRYFPLDGNCNPVIPTAAPDPVRCTAAKALICAAGRRGSFDAAGEIFRHQPSVEEADVRSAVEPILGRDELEQCLASPATTAALEEDVRFAMQHRIRGTPMLLVNGRKIDFYPPLLYALVLAEGDAEHPAFAALPAPRARRGG